MDYNDEIIDCANELNSKLSKYIKMYNEELEKLKLKTFYININSIKDIKKIISNNKKYFKKPGIYYFEIMFKCNEGAEITQNYNFDELEKEWTLIEKEKDEKRKHIPKIIKERVDKHKAIKSGEWYPFYIGKSANIGDRIAQHLHLSESSSTSSLRLSQIKSGIFKDAVYRLKILPLEDFSGDNYWIVRKIESNLRELINPICGKQ